MISGSDNAANAMTSHDQHPKNEATFENKVINYIKKNHPDVSLSELMEKLIALAPGHAVTMDELTGALINANAKLGQDPDEHDYVNQVLNQQTTLQVGVNYFFNTMMMNRFFPSEENNIKLEQW